MNTPWGKSDRVDKLQSGLSWVTTPSHGGFMVGRGYANNHLSKSAIKRGMVFGNYYAYEEDCDWAIVAWEIGEEYLEQLFPNMQEYTVEKAKQRILECLSLYHADYLIEIGITPIPAQYEIYLQRQTIIRFKIENNPDYITAGIRTDNPEIMKCWTADGKVYYVDANSYRKQYGNIPLLSKCNNVERIV